MNVPRALADLGETSEAVAAALRAVGVAGERCANDACPVANYLAARFPGHRFEVSNTRVQIDGEGRVVPPAAVLDFVYDFDSGRFPDLVREGSE